MSKFPLGKPTVTRHLYDDMQENPKLKEHVYRCYEQYKCGNWGSSGEYDAKQNDIALQQGDGRIFATYRHEEFPKIFIITEADRSVTTVLYASDY